ncbi:GAK system CofD-like protein [Desulfomicrobium escambiense]|uniref:GAK system CofD-like protein n=1 Tax=Desulfomicrobium escambiense TaxID=29503 RepID=UPI00041F1641|nr:GAK system CofD-like protein [Desulfomicrobium escambiense]
MTTPATPIVRELRIPDPERLASALRAPDLGPRILFFTGGTALTDTSRALVAYTRNSVHLVTPFDSGGSSAALRRHFGMPAVGDLRNRLMALADRTRHEFAEIYDLFAHRLPKNAPQAQLWAELETLMHGSHPLIAKVSDPLRKTVQHHLQVFQRAAGPQFDLRGACIGNLFLTAGYLENGRNPDPIVGTFSNLVHAHGQARLLLDSNLQLRALLEDGRYVIGQHLITGKETKPLNSAIAELCLVDPARDNAPVRPPIRGEIRACIGGADLICYPIGSFYSSLVANLLPAGVGAAISRTPCPKVFVPNTLPDPEAIGLSLADQVRTLLRHLQADAPNAIAVGDVLDAILLDPCITYRGAENLERELATLGLRIIKTPLTVRETGAIDPHLLCQTLISLA